MKEDPLDKFDDLLPRLVALVPSADTSNPMSALASALDVLEVGAKAKRDLNTPAASTATQDDASGKLNEATRRADDLEAELLSQKNTFKAFKDGCLLPDDVDASTPISLLRGLYDKFNLARKECLKIDINPHLGDIDASSAHAALAGLAATAASDRRLLAFARQTIAKLALELDVQGLDVDTTPLHVVLQHIGAAVSPKHKLLMRVQGVLDKLAADPDLDNVDTSSAHAALTCLGGIVYSERKLFNSLLSHPEMRNYESGTPAERLKEIIEIYQEEKERFASWCKQTGNTELSPNIYTAARAAISWRDRADEERDAAVAECDAAKKECATAMSESTKANKFLRTAQNDLQVANKAKERALDQIDKATRALKVLLGPKAFTFNSSLLQLIGDIEREWKRDMAPGKGPSASGESAEQTPGQLGPRVNEIVTSILSPIFFSNALELNPTFEDEDLRKWAQRWATGKSSSAETTKLLRDLLETSSVTRDSLVCKFDPKLRFCNDHKEIAVGAERIARAWAKRPAPDDAVDACLQLFASAITARAFGMDTTAIIATGFEAALELIKKG